MKAILLILGVLPLFGTMVDDDGQADADQAGSPAVRFVAVDVYLDSGDQALAAYQFELAAEVGQVTIVGVEGGEHAAFAEPPYYDPAALANDRIVIAAFNTGDDLPAGNTRVARVHLRVTGDQTPEYVVNLKVAGTSDGTEINATPTWAEGEAE